MNQTRITIVNNQVVLKRYYKRGYHELGNYFYNLNYKNNPYYFYNPKNLKGEELELHNKIENEILLKEDILEIDGEGLELVHQFFKEDDPYSYVAWVKNNANVFFLSVSRHSKDWGQIVVKKTSLKPKFFNEIVVLDKQVIKTRSEVFYLGKKVQGALAESFAKVEHTHFFQDEKTIYSFYNPQIRKIEISNEMRLFIPFSYLFANQNFIYNFCTSSGKFEIVSGDFVGNLVHANAKDIKLIYPNMSDSEREDVINKIREAKNYEKLFTLFFPNIQAKWDLKI